MNSDTVRREVNDFGLAFSALTRKMLSAEPLTIAEFAVMDRITDCLLMMESLDAARGASRARICAVREYFQFTVADLERMCEPLTPEPPRRTRDRPLPRADPAADR